MTEHPATPNTATAPRSYGIDLLRGVACLSVVLFHFISRGVDSRWIPAAPLPSLEPMARYGYLGVHLFFMISGYVILLSALGRSPRAFVASRVSRLYPALWAGATITMLVTWTHGDPRFAVSWADWFWNMTLVPQYVGASFVDGAYWSLAVELQFYVVVWLALVARLESRLDQLLWAWLLLSLVDAIRPMYPVERWLIANWAPLFTIGAAAFLATRHGWTRPRILMVLTSVALMLWHAWREVTYVARSFRGAPPVFPIVATVLVAFVLLFLAISTGVLHVPKTRWATLPGKLTYPVYLVHQYAGYVVFTVLVENRLNPEVSLAIVFALVIGVATAIHHLVELPLAPVLRRWVAARRVATVTAA
ncbi:MAG: acyltransferase [Gemmatimonadota bacterium]